MSYNVIDLQALDELCGRSQASQIDIAIQILPDGTWRVTYNGLEGFGNGLIAASQDCLAKQPGA